MPELPDLQVISSNLNNIFKGKTLSKITFINNKKLNVEELVYSNTLVNSNVITVSRFGKEILFNFSNGHFLSLHLMREGKLFISNDNKKHTIVELLFNDNSLLTMSDFMGQAKATLDPALTEVPDPFDEKFTLNYLKQRLIAKKNSVIKSFLIDQNNILGIGNAYADEILWESKLSPKTKCGNIPDNVIEYLYEQIRSVLSNAETQIKCIAPDIISGEIRDFLKVHNKNIKTTPTGYEIRTEKISGKSSYFTDEQIYYD